MADDNRKDENDPKPKGPQADTADADTQTPPVEPPIPGQSHDPKKDEEGGE